MTWQSKMKDFGGGDLTFLSSDGEVIIFIPVDEPVLLTGKFKGKEQERVGCPVMTDEGFQLFVTGKRTARKISKFEDRFKTNAVMVVRHGGEGDINSTYEVSLLNDEAKVKHLLDMAKKEYKPDMLKQAIEDAAEVMNS